MNILQCMADPAIFRPHLKGGPETWAPWYALLAALFGLPMTLDQLALYRQCTGRTDPPAAPSTEAWLVVGRRGGKSFVMALIAVYLGSFRDWRPYLAPGETPTIMVIAQDRQAARIILNYVKALILETPMLKALVVREGAEFIELSNRVTIEVHTASFRRVRGYTCVAALLDEVAIWRSDDSAEPDVEVLAALRPSMATIPDAVMIGASSPYARKGILWDAHREHHGKLSPVLCWQAASRTMNPTIPEEYVAAEIERDPAKNRAEYLAIFRDDVEAFVSKEIVERLIEPGRSELPPITGVTYAAFTDPSGGSSDSFSLAIGHREGDIAVLDCIRERRPPFSPEAVVEEYCELLRRYGIYQISGDRYGGQWVAEQFSKRGISYVPATRAASDIYRDCLPVLNSGQAELLDVPVLMAQLCSLERRTSKAGRDSITHPDGGHDDVANAVAGVLTGLTSGPRYGLLDDHVLGITPGTEAEVQPYWDRYITALQLQNRRMF